MFDHVSQGQRWKPKAAELNAMLDAAAAFYGGQGVASSPMSASNGLNLRPQVVRVYNDTGVDVDRYTCWGLGAARWALDTNDSDDTTAFRLVAFTGAQSMPAVVQQGIKAGNLGTAIISGTSLVKVSGDGASQYTMGNPNSSGVIVPGTGPAVTLLQSRPTGGGVVLCSIGDVVRTLPCNWVWVVNDDGPTIKRFDCVRFGGHPYSGSQFDATRPNDIETVFKCYRGGNMGSGDQLGIMLDEIAYGKYGRMAISGVAIGKVKYASGSGFSGQVECIADSQGVLTENNSDSAVWVFRALGPGFRSTQITDDGTTDYGLHLIVLAPQKLNVSSQQTWTYRAPTSGIAAPTVVVGTPGSGQWTFDSQLCRLVTFTSGSTWSETGSTGLVHNIGPAAVPASALITVRLQGSKLVTSYFSGGGTEDTPP